eukprot:PhF_6_TR33635/c0_g1_i1/m.49156
MSKPITPPVSILGGESLVSNKTTSQQNPTLTVLIVEPDGPQPSTTEELKQVRHLEISVATNEIYQDDDDDLGTGGSGSGGLPGDVITGATPPPPIATNNLANVDEWDHLLDAKLISPRKNKPRAIFIDWMRSIAVFAVVIVHIFVSIRRVTDVSKEMDEKIDGSFRTVLQFGMPMFFYFSGRSAAFAKKGFWPFFVDKLQRLLFPCIMGLLLIVIPTCYVGREYRPCAPAAMNNFFEFYGNYFTSQIACNGLDWYWFLPVLFIISCVDQIPMKWVKDRYPKTFSVYWSWKWNKDGYAFTYVAVFTAVLFLVGNLLGVNNGHIVLFVLPYWTCLIVVPLMPIVRKYNAIYLLYSIAPSACLILAMVVDAPYTGAVESQSAIVLMIFFYNYYYIEGFLDSIFDEEWKAWRNSSSLHASLKPVALLGLIVSLAACSPSTSEHAGYLYTYPLYKAVPSLCFLYVSGTWIWLVILVRWGETFYNDVLNKTEYKHITTSSMLVYLVHWFFIDTIQVLLIRPYHLGLVSGVCILIPGVLLCCAALYGVLYYGPSFVKHVILKRGGRGGEGNRNHQKAELESPLAENVVA